MSWVITGQERPASAISNMKALSGLYSGQATRDRGRYGRNTVTHKIHWPGNFWDLRGPRTTEVMRHLTHSPRAQNADYKPLGTSASIFTVDLTNSTSTPPPPLAAGAAD